MNTFTKKVSLGAVIAWTLLSGVQAAKLPREVTVNTSRVHWTLTTADTRLKISVSNNKIYIDGIKNPAQGWNWAPIASEVPLPGRNSIRTAGAPANIDQTPNWTFAGASEDKSDGFAVTLHFVSTTPSLELKSVWTARPGPGPVENRLTIQNKSGGVVVYSPDISAGVLRLKADKRVRLWNFEKTSIGQGHFDNQLIGPGVHRSIDSRQIPFIMFDVNSTHGAYIGYEWELGAFQLATDADPLDITVSILPITEAVPQGANEIFTIPSVYYGTYKGDVDDGSNRFKKWFWNHKITRSLHDNADEPWTEVCVQQRFDEKNGLNDVTGATPQCVYDAIAATGVECVKFDFWDGTGQCWYTGRDWMFHQNVWPNGFDYAAKAHRAGLKASCIWEPPIMIAI